MAKSSKGWGWGLALLGVVGGGVLLFSRSRGSDSGASSGTTSDGNPEPAAPDRAAPDPAAAAGLRFPDCNHMQVIDTDAFVSAVEDVYRTKPGSGPAAADAMTRAFFDRHLPASCRVPGKTDEVITGPPGALPTKAPLPQQIMYASVFLGMASLLLIHGQWPIAMADAQAKSVVQMLEDSHVTQATWNEVFAGGEVPEYPPGRGRGRS